MVGSMQTISWAPFLFLLLVAPAGHDLEGRLEGLHRRITSGELGNVHGVMVVQDGQKLVEWYFTGTDEVRGAPVGKVTFDASKLHDLRSVSKSVLSILFGIALAGGQIPSLDRPVLDYFPEYGDLRTPDRLKVRLRDILSMTAGLEWDESTWPYTDPRNGERAMDAAPDRFRYVLAQKVVSPPGRDFRYSGGSVALAAEILARATKTPLEVYAEQKLFRPLGIKNFVWLKDDKGFPIAASGLRLTLPDLTRIGQLILGGGVWNGRRVVPADWVTASTTPHAQVAPDPACGLRYGYYWWLGQGCDVTPRTPWIAAFGNGGERIFVVPSRKLVVTITAGLYNTPHERTTTNAIFKAVLDVTK
jgi:CubicO group peptidase (beta-lactamase class C family)